MSQLIYIPVEKIHPHPDNPRKVIGDLTELAESIRQNGVMQNLTVVPDGNGEYTAVIGHRRLAAAQLAGLTEVPCVVAEMSAKEQVQTMLLENMQRSDLTVYEQAQGFQMMLDMGETVESLAESSGFSTTTIRNRVKLTKLDAEKFKASEKRGATLQDYMELDKLSDPVLKNEALEAIGTPEFKNVLKRAIMTQKQQQFVADRVADVAAWATEISAVDYSTFEFVCGYQSYNWKKTSVVEKPDDADVTQYYYRVGSWGVDIYVRKADRKKTDEERRKQARARARACTQLEDTLNSIAERHYELRRDFVANFHATKKRAADICLFAAQSLVQYGAYTPNTKVLEAVIGVNDLPSFDRETIWASISAEAAKRPEFILLVSAYAQVDAEHRKYFRTSWNSEKRESEFLYDANTELDQLYEFLISLGYEMSEEELAMQNGTHELLVKAINGEWEEAVS